MPGHAQPPHADEAPPGVGLHPPAWVRDTRAAVQSAFVIVVIAVAAVGVGGALLALLTGHRAWEDYGREALVRDSDPGPDTGPAVRELRQFIEAGNARRVARGQAPLDVEAELRRTLSAVNRRRVR